MERTYFQTYWPGIAWFFIMCVLLFMPGTDVPEPDNWLKKIFFDKWVHTFLFGTFAWLLMFALRARQPNLSKLKIQLFIIAISIVAWGLATEYIQRDFCISRGFDLWDWAADSAGITAAWIYHFIAVRKQEKTATAGSTGS